MYCITGPDHTHTLSRDSAYVTRSLVLPQMAFIQRVSTRLLPAFFIEFPSDAGGVTERVSFYDVDRMAGKLRAFNFK
jgi:hypothetical protein